MKQHISTLSYSNGHGKPILSIAESIVSDGIPIHIKGTHSHLQQASPHSSEAKYKVTQLV